MLRIPHTSGWRNCSNFKPIFCLFNFRFKISVLYRLVYLVYYGRDGDHDDGADDNDHDGDDDDDAPSAADSDDDDDDDDGDDDNDDDDLYVVH